DLLHLAPHGLTAAVDDHGERARKALPRTERGGDDLERVGQLLGKRFSAAGELAGNVFTNSQRNEEGEKRPPDGAGRGIEQDERENRSRNRPEDERRGRRLDLGDVERLLEPCEHSLVGGDL